VKNIADQLCTESRSKYFMFNDFFSINRAVVEIMWKYSVEPDRLQMTI